MVTNGTHSEETKAKIALGQQRPEVLAAKKAAASKYWEEVRKGIRPPRRRPDNPGRPAKPLAERFWDKVDVRGAEECWLFSAKKRAGDYGAVSSKGEYLAHRVSWFLTNGPIPEGKLVLHTCDTPLCCNPSHLFLGDHQDNSDDKVVKDRHLYGERSPLAKLDDLKIAEIFRLRQTGISQQAIANRLEVSQSLVSKILLKRLWKHLP